MLQAMIPRCGISKLFSFIKLLACGWTQCALGWDYLELSLEPIDLCIEPQVFILEVLNQLSRRL